MRKPTLRSPPRSGSQIRRALCIAFACIAALHFLVYGIIWAVVRLGWLPRVRAVSQAPRESWSSPMSALGPWGFVVPLALSVLVALCFYILGSWLNHNLVLPLRRLSEAANGLEGGTNARLLATRGGLETRELATVLNSLMERQYEGEWRQRLLLQSESRLDLLSLNLRDRRVSSLNSFRLFGLDEPGEFDFLDWAQRFKVRLEEEGSRGLGSFGPDRQGEAEGRGPGDAEYLFERLSAIQAGRTIFRGVLVETAKGERRYLRLNLMRHSPEVVVALTVDRTEEYLAQGELATLSTRLNVALASSPNVAIFDVNLETMIIWASDSFYSLLELRRPPSGSYILTEFEKRLFKGERALIQGDQALAPGGFWAAGSRVLRLRLPRSGKDRWIEIRATRTSRGSLGTVLDISREVSEKRAVQERLDSAQEMSRVILSALTEAVLGLDQEGRCIFINPSAEGLFGYARDELIGKDLGSLLLRPDLDPEAIGPWDPLAECLRRGIPVSHDGLRLSRRDGESFLASCRVQPIFRNGEQSGAVVSISDISDILAQSLRLKAILANSIDIIYLKDSDLRLVLASDSFARLMGKAQGKSLVGLRGADIFPEALALAVEGRERNVLERNRPCSGYIIELPTANSTRWLNLTIIPLRDGPQEVIGVLGMARDVTEALQLEEELRGARDEAERANRAKSVFLASMSHEIRTPLNAIIGYSQVVCADLSLAPLHRKNVATIMRAGEHLLTLINSILEISKIEAGRVEIQNSGFELAQLMIDIESMFSQRAAAKGLAFKVGAEPGLPDFLIGDLPKIRQVLINVIGNAIKFTESGRVGVTLSRVEGESGQAQLLCAVEDSGPGMDEADMAKVFKPFSQGRAGLGAQAGTGLGLAISHQYASLMGGSLSARSQPGKGSVFFFRIPLVQDKEPPESRAEKAEGPMGLGGDGLRPLIMVADDSDINRDVFKDMLEQVGYRVVVAEDGQAALAALAQSPVDLVLMDLNMPKLGGEAAIGRIRGDRSINQAKIVVVSASAFVEDRQRALDAGADDYLAKPVSRQELLSTVGRHLGLSLGPSSTVEAKPPGLNRPRPANIAALKGESLAALRQAALELAPVQAEWAIKEIEAQDPALAAALREKLDKFDFTSILEYCGGNG